MKTIRIISLLAILIALASVTVAEQTVKLGMIYPQSGPYSVYGLDEQRAAEMAVEEINADGGILGQPIELVTGDSKSRADVSAEKVFEFIKSHKVEAVFGGVAGEVTGVVADICQRHEIVYMAPVAFANTDGGKKSHRYSFQGGFNPWMAAKATAGYVNQNLSGQKLCYVVTDKSWGWNTENNLRTWTNTKDDVVHKRFLVPAGAKGAVLDKVIQQVRACQPDAVIFVQLGDDLVASLKAVNEAGLKNQLAVVVPVLDLNVAEAVGAEVLAGVVGCTDWTWNVPLQENHRAGLSFVERFSKRYGCYPSSVAAGVYTCFREYQAAVERAGSFDGPAVVEALEGHQFSSLKGEQHWRKWDHQAVGSVYVIQGKPETSVKADKYRADFFRVLKELPGSSVVVTFDEWTRHRERAGLSTNLEPLQSLVGR